MPSRGSGEATAVASTTVSPVETRAAPEACLAMRPVSKTSRLPPASSTATSVFVDIESSFHFSLGKLEVGRPGWDGGRTPRRFGAAAGGIAKGREGPRTADSYAQAPASHR